MFTVRIKPKSDESLISFVTRFASENGTKMLSIWHDNSRNKAINPQKADAHLLEQAPEALLMLNNLAEATQVSKNRLIAMTFYHVLQKFYYHSETSRSRILKGMIRNDFHFCPFCIKEQAHIKLLWKLDGVNFCMKHQVPLSRSCSQCGNIVKLKDIEYIELCPYCNTELKNTQMMIRKFSAKELKEQSLLQTIWSQLLCHSPNYMSPSEVATKLVYLLNEESSFFERNTIQRNADILKICLPHVLQIARDALLRKRTVHISTLLDVMVYSNIDYEYFEKISIPYGFRESIRTSKRDNVKNTGCMSPWCASYQKSDFLVKTGTKAKRYSDGRYLRKYVACTVCGSRFAYNIDGNMVELDGFFKGYNDLTNMFKKKGQLTLQECRRPADFKRDRWWSVIAYFSTRPIFGEVEKLDEDLLLAFVQSVEQNGNMNNIHKWSCWNSYRHFLLYRYHPRVMNAIVFSKRKVPLRHDIKDYENKIESLCRSMLENDQDISVERICSLVNISSTTIRKWGVHIYIKNMKKEQGEKRLVARKEEIIEKVDQFFKQNEKCRVLSKDIYNFIGMSQSYMKSIAPDLNQYISMKRQNCSIQRRSTLEKLKVKSNAFQR
ncbi:TniQ family protein [Cohnella sp. LGH]|uniref:TniQ family protein n=1 Tax=Cohnella sp. LGH TaxID=1619153 RepID=UPI001AD9C183|nr:TniQ family protein [Cohnella sp. LGH]QTH41659.1 TniQ family protein [Cohnella sp. LGH]